MFTLSLLTTAERGDLEHAGTRQVYMQFAHGWPHAVSMCTQYTLYFIQIRLLVTAAAVTDSKRPVVHCIKGDTANTIRIERRLKCLSVVSSYMVRTMPLINRSQLQYHF